MFFILYRGGRGVEGISERRVKNKEGCVLGRRERVEGEIKRLLGIFEPGLDDNVLKVMTPLIRNTAYITVVIDELHDEINKSGFIEEYNNGGGQSGVKESVHVKLHKDYSKLQKENIRCLVDYVPAAKKEDSMLSALRAKKTKQ